MTQRPTAPADPPAVGGAMAGRAALVLGGSGGIGTACAAALLRDGCSVTLTARRSDALQDAASRLRPLAAHGATVTCAAADGTTGVGVRTAVEAAVGAFGRLDACVGLVGGGVIGPILAMDDDETADNILRNAHSAFLAVKYATPAIVASGGGSVVLVSSTAARMTMPYLASFAAGKAAVDAMVRSAADELGPVRVRVNAVRPGLVRSQPDMRIFQDPRMVERFRENTPLGRSGEPDDVAAVVRYLAGPESSWTTGQSIAVDGGTELRRHPVFESYARTRLGDDAVDTAQRGQVPGWDPFAAAVRRRCADAT